MAHSSKHAREVDAALEHIIIHISARDPLSDSDVEMIRSAQSALRLLVRGEEIARGALGEALEESQKLRSDRLQQSMRIRKWLGPLADVVELATSADKVSDEKYSTEVYKTEDPAMSAKVHAYSTNVVDAGMKLPIDPDTRIKIRSAWGHDSGANSE